MKISKTLTALTLAGGLLWAPASAMADDITIGMATAQSGWMEAYDKPAREAALIRIDEINAAGGLLGITVGGMVADYLKSRFPSGRLVVGYVSIIATAPVLYPRVMA